MEPLFSNQPISFVLVIDPSTGNQYYVPSNVAYSDRDNPSPVNIEGVLVDSSITSVTSSYINGGTF
jgi:hypothetical protein